MGAPRDQYHNIEILKRVPYFHPTRGTILVKARRSEKIRIYARTLLVMAVAALTISSCSSSKSNYTKNPNEEIARPEAIRDPVPAGHCRVVATIVNVHPPQQGGKEEDPCRRFPCSATVRVDSVLGYGSGFRSALGPGQVIEARFVYTLAPSREAHPGQAFSLPGLGEGDRFQADLSGGSEAMGQETESYGVALYKRIP